MVGSLERLFFRGDFFTLLYNGASIRTKITYISIFDKTAKSPYAPFTKGGAEGGGFLFPEKNKS